MIPSRTPIIKLITPRVTTPRITTLGLCCCLILSANAQGNTQSNVQSNVQGNAQNSTPQIKGADGTEQYQPIFFSEYTPQTALDMVKRLPGFILIDTDNDIRGFASGAGNVLIEGSRPTTKSGGIEEALSRIPATQVARIEILRGATGAADTGGQAVVANVIKVKQSAAKRWQMGMDLADDGKVSPSAELALSQHVAGWATSVKVSAIEQYQPRDASIQSFDGNNQLIKSQTEKRPSTLNEIFLSGDGKRIFDDQQLSVNARLGWSQFVPTTTRLSHNTELANTSTVQNTGDSRFHNQRNSQYYTGELGIDWQYQLSDDWQWRLLNLNNNQNWFVDADAIHQTPVDTFSSGSRLRFDEHKSENILRSTISHIGSGLLTRQEYGVEAAYSHLESWLKLSSIDASGQPLSVNRNTYSKAIEKRSEAFANLTWQLGDFTVETALAAEHSQLSVSGNSESVQSLFFVKPSLAVIYDANELTQYRFNLRRSVGQLDFSDVAASADLVNDRAFSGNPQLSPDSKVRAALAWDYRFFDRGAIGVELYHEWRSDVLEQMVLPSGNHGLGNAGDATVQGVKITANLPLDNWIEDALVSVEADFIDSTFDDPATGQSRALNQISSPNININFRQDLVTHKLSWGFGYEARVDSEEYYVNETNNFRTQGRWNAFIESLAFANFKVRLAARNLGDEKQSWDRLIYQGDRNGALQQSEKTQRHRGPAVKLTVSRAF